MARATAITATKCGGPNKMALATANAVTASTAFYVEPSALDEEVVYRFTPSSASSSAKLTVYAGGSYAGVQNLDLAPVTAAGYYFTLNTANFVIPSGENAGLIKMQSTVAGSIEQVQPWSA